MGKRKGLRKTGFGADLEPAPDRLLFADVDLSQRRNAASIGSRERTVNKGPVGPDPTGPLQMAEVARHDPKESLPHALVRDE